MKASDITCCDDCPLYENDCPGGCVAGAGGNPIEPPCTSWKGDEEIYEGMYAERDWSKKELKRIIIMQEEFERQEQIREEKEKQQRKEYLRKRVREITGEEYQHIQLEKGDLCNVWLCPRCNTWRHVGSESWSGGIGKAWCAKCGKWMAYCQELE
jgi:hypothetical protein